MKAFLTLFLIAWIQILPAQGFFEGTISYAITLTGEDASILMENNPAKKMDLHLKDDNFIIQLYDARVPRTFLYIGDSNHTYIVDAGNAVYYMHDYFMDTLPTPKAEKVKDAAEVKGIPCSVYQTKGPGHIIQYYVSPAYKADVSKYKGKKEAKADFLTPGLDGMIPLKKIIKEKNLTTTIEYVKITPKPLELFNFRIPKTFKRKKRDHRI